MNHRVRSKVLKSLVVTLAIIVVPVFAEFPAAVSPGAVDRIAEIEGRCPSFSWGVVPAAEHCQLIVYRLPEGMEVGEVDLDLAEEVLYTEVAGQAAMWTPNLTQCLTPGEGYAWFVRAVFRKEEGEIVEASEWSNGRFFSISAMPSVREVEEALSVLRRYTRHGRFEANIAGEHLIETEGSSRAVPLASLRPALSPQGQKSVTSAKTAIKGSVSDTTGETYGVVGVSASTDGAGLGASNTAGGPDLALDGSAQGMADTLLTESGIDRPHALPQTFSIGNSGGGGMTLQVAGVIAGDGSQLTDVVAVDLECTGCVDGGTIDDDAVTASKIAAGAVGRSEIDDYAILERHLGSIRVVKVECNGECWDSTLWDVCGSDFQPIAVSCDGTAEWGGASYSCGGDNECKYIYLGWGVSLDSLCDDGNGWDAIVTCMLD